MTDRLGVAAVSTYLTVTIASLSVTLYKENIGTFQNAIQYDEDILIYFFISFF